MMSYVPPDMQVVRLDLVTNAVINTNTAHVLVASPGAGRRLRLWLAGASLRQNQAAGTQLRMIFGATAPAASYVEVLLADGRRSLENTLPGGLILPDDSSLRALSVCTVASVAVTAWILYTSESI
ncbi:MAG: hypothetical protein M3Q74_06095 [Pseudomonadota bacterium]|nr:hypothetical protein [Pseudomonadota bacterium]